MKCSEKDEVVELILNFKIQPCARIFIEVIQYTIH